MKAAKRVSDRRDFGAMMAVLRLGAFGACIVTLVFYVVAYAGLPGISPDTWTYYELSRSIFSDFYRVGTVRQFEIMTDRSLAFPPLFPVLMAVVNAAWGWGILAGAVVNLPVAVATGVLLWISASRLTGEGLYGILVFALLLASPSYLGIVMFGVADALAILLFIAAVTICVRPGALRIGDMIGLGLVGGLGVMARFDMLPAMAVFGVVAAIRCEGRLAAAAGVFVLAFAIALSPWIAYSLQYFGKPFASDNSRAVLLAMRFVLTAYYSPDDVLPTVWTAPVEWFQALLAKVSSSAIGASRAVLEVGFLPLLGIVVAARWLARKGTPGERGAPLAFGRLSRHPLAPAWIAAAALFATVALTGFDDARYFFRIVLVADLALVLALSASVRRQTAIAPRMVPRLLVAAIVLSQAAVSSYLIARKGVAAEPLSVEKLAAGYAPIVTAVRSERPRGATVLTDCDFVDPFRFGALTGLRTIIEPSNLNACNLRQIVARYRVDFVLTQDEGWRSVLAPALERQPDWPAGLWRVRAEGLPAMPAICPRGPQPL